MRCTRLRAASQLIQTQTRQDIDKKWFLPIRQELGLELLEALGPIERAYATLYQQLRRWEQEQPAAAAEGCAAPTAGCEAASEAARACTSAAPAA